jgi:hypothetical protein
MAMGIFTCLRVKWLQVLGIFRSYSFTLGKLIMGQVKGPKGPIITMDKGSKGFKNINMPKVIMAKLEIVFFAIP